MVRSFLRDESGAVTVDWVALTAGIMVLGIMVAFAVMSDSAGYLMDEFEYLNAQYEQDAISISALGQSIDINE